MAQAPKPTGGRRPGQFGTTELRLGRASGIGEYYDVLEKHVFPQLCDECE